MNNWPINDATADLLEARMQANPPKLALDVGSGRSTVIMARYAERVVALEHLGKYALETSRALAQEGTKTEVRLVPIHNHVEGAWYDVRAVEDLWPDFVLIDGPPMSIGRGAGLPILWDRLTEDWEIWLDDWDRDHEQAIVKDWQERYPIQVEELLPTLVKITEDPSKPSSQTISAVNTWVELYQAERLAWSRIVRLNRKPISQRNPE